MTSYSVSVKTGGYLSLFALQYVVPTIMMSRDCARGTLKRLINCKANQRWQRLLTLVVFLNIKAFERGPTRDCFVTNHPLTWCTNISVNKWHAYNLGRGQCGEITEKRSLAV